MSGEYNADYFGDDERPLACGHAHPCAMRCEECRKRSCPDCTHIHDNVLTCLKCAPSVVEFLVKQAGELAALGLTNATAGTDLRQTVEHAGSLGRWAAQINAVRLVTNPTMAGCLEAMGVK